MYEHPELSPNYLQAVNLLLHSLGEYASHQQFSLDCAQVGQSADLLLLVAHLAHSKVRPDLGDCQQHLVLCCYRCQIQHLSQNFHRRLRWDQVRDLSVKRLAYHWKSEDRQLLQVRT